METYALFNESFFTNRPWWMPSKLYTVVCQRSNPRPKEYMKALLLEKFPTAKIISIEDIPSDAQDFIVLYADAIGLGGSCLEKKLLNRSRNIKIINGRRRVFPLTPYVRFRLLFKRFVEMTFLPELFLAPFLVILGSTFAVKDRLQGRT